MFDKAHYSEGTRRRLTLEDISEFYDAFIDNEAVSRQELRDIREQSLAEITGAYKPPEFSPPPTRSERRKQERNKQNRR